MRYNDGFIVGNGAKRNIEIGFVPSFVRVTNLTDRATFEAAIAQAIAFDSGSVEIKSGMRIDASDGGWRGIVKQVILASGTWAGGNAAGWIVFEDGSLAGSANVGDNDGIYSSEQVDVAGSANVADVNGAGLVTLGVEREADGSAVDAESGVTPYFGSEASEAKGFSISATISVDNKLLHYQAWAPDPGSAPVDMSRG